MATLAELFAGEFSNLLKVDTTLGFAKPDGSAAWNAVARHYLDFDECARFLSFYVTEQFATLDNLQSLLSQTDLAIAESMKVLSQGPNRFAYEPDPPWSTELTFTGRVILYVEAKLDETWKRQLNAAAAARGLRLQIRDGSYQDAVNESERPAAFLSHDSRDKPFVEHLAIELRKVLCPVWYDAFSLKPGDSLQASIDAGLRDSKTCVVVLSPNYFDNSGWGKGEFAAALGRQFAEGGGVLIPIWHGVNRRDVAAFSPLVADIVAITDPDVNDVFHKLHRRLITS